MQANPEAPKKNNDKSKKISRKPLAAKNKWRWGAMTQGPLICLSVLDLTACAFSHFFLNLFAKETCNPFLYAVITLHERPDRVRAVLQIPLLSLTYMYYLFTVYPRNTFKAIVSHVYYNKYYYNILLRCSLLWKLLLRFDVFIFLIFCRILTTVTYQFSSC